MQASTAIAVQLLAEIERQPPRAETRHEWCRATWLLRHVAGYAIVWQVQRREPAGDSVSALGSSNAASRTVAYPGVQEEVNHLVAGRHMSDGALAEACVAKHKVQNTEVFAFENVSVAAVPIRIAMGDGCQAKREEQHICAELLEALREESSFDQHLAKRHQRLQTQGSQEGCAGLRPCREACRLLSGRGSREEGRSRRHTGSSPLAEWDSWAESHVVHKRYRYRLTRDMTYIASSSLRLFFSIRVARPLIQTVSAYMEVELSILCGTLALPR